jgi:hypothetical protein
MMQDRQRSPGDRQGSVALRRSSGSRRRSSPFKRKEEYAGIARPMPDALEQRDATLPHATASPSMMHERERRGTARIKAGQVLVRAP